jgi:ferric-dicitrate binding protein FerR (iron transport regulator)
VSETEPKRVFVGLLPSGTVTFVAEGEADPITILLRDADQKLAAERATREPQRWRPRRRNCYRALALAASCAGSWAAEIKMPTYSVSLAGR